MAKNLFEDLLNNDINFDRYDNQNKEFEEKLKIKDLEFSIGEFASKEQTLIWANNVIEFFENELKSKHNLTSKISNYEEFKNLLSIAKDMIEKHNLELAEIEKRNTELKIKEQEKYENECITKAKEIDDEIKFLYNQKNRGVFWCENLDNLILTLKNSNNDVKDKVKNISKLSIMQNVEQNIKIAIEYDKQISVISKMPRTSGWCTVVRNVQNRLNKEDEEKKFIQFMYKIELLKSLIEEVELIQIQEEKERQQRKLELQQQKELEKQRKIEEKQRLKQEELEKKQLEEKIQHEVELVEKQKVFESLLGSDFECQILDDQLVLNKVKNKKLKILKIPEGIDVIYKDALSNCKNIISIQIPASLKQIDKGALNYCKKLKVITVDTKNKKFTSSNNVLYNKNKKTLIFYAPENTAERFDCPNTLETIGHRAFENNKYLKIVYVNTTKYIQSYAFRNCKNLNYLMLVHTEKIYEGAFHKCKNLKTVEQYSTIYIQGDVFKGCKKRRTAYYNKYKYFQ